MSTGTALDHVTIAAEDFEAARRCYDALFGALGLKATVDFTDPEEDEYDKDTVAAVGYSTATGQTLFLLVASRTSTHGAHVAFGVPDRGTVEAVVSVASACGATVLQPPRDWEAHHIGYYGTQLADPAGNVIEIVHRLPPTRG